MLFSPFFLRISFGLLEVFIFLVHLSNYLGDFDIPSKKIVQEMRLSRKTKKSAR